MIKKFLITTLIVLGIFFVIINLSKNDLQKEICTAQDSTCSENYICDFNDNICVQAEKCSEKKPEICITLFDPVCSNGKEYSNSCVACSQGAQYYYKGKC